MAYMYYEESGAAMDSAARPLDSTEFHPFTETLAWPQEPSIGSLLESLKEFS